MVIDGDDQHGDGSLLDEKRSFDLRVRLLLAYGDLRTIARRGKEEQERTMLLIDTLTSALNKCENQQDPSYRHDDASSSSLSSVESKRRPELSNEPIRAEPIREIKPLVRRKVPVKRKPIRIEPGVMPKWVVDLMRKKNGVDPARLIIEKAITASDLKRDQGRLLMPFNQMADMDFLNEVELNIMKQYVEKSRKQGVDVILVDSDGKQWKLNLRTWGMRTSSNYVLCSGWNSVALHYDLKENQIIRFWSFHSQDGKLYFAFVHLPRTPAPDMAQPQAQDPAQAVALPQAQDPYQAMALALAPAIASSSSSSMALVVTRDSNELCVETLRRLGTHPKQRRTHRVWVPAPTRDSGELGQSILEGLDLNRPLPEVCTEMAPFEARQETDRSTSSLVSATETSLESVTETMTLDLELRL